MIEDDPDIHIMIGMQNKIENRNLTIAVMAVVIVILVYTLSIIMFF